MTLRNAARGFNEPLLGKSVVTSLPAPSFAGAKRRKDETENDEQTYLCYYETSMSAQILIGGLTGARYANLANALFATIYGKSLIFQVGT